MFSVYVQFLGPCYINRSIVHTHTMVDNIDSMILYNIDKKYFTAILSHSVSKVDSVTIHRIGILLDCLLNFSLLFIYITLPNVRKIPL